ncbi:MAG: thiamine-phosphate kinase [Proteobacteria bacterium]|nr:thiamine-phosphate kinase [Pseudomonadota bacterium]
MPQHPSNLRLSEFELISRLFVPLATGEDALGLTDDGAIIPARPGYDLVVTTDALVSGIHFRSEDSAATVAARSLCSNLSDLAAMGAEAHCYSLAIALPVDWTLEWVTEFAGTLGDLQNQYSVFLLGGDTVSTPGPLTISITAMGYVPTGKALRRGGAIPGDRIWVSGSIGDAAMGIALLTDRLECPDGEMSSFLTSRFETPIPRLELGQSLRDLASAAIDVSDGLIADLTHITDTSSVGADVHLDQIPLSAAAEALLAKNSSLSTYILGGGDDYELLFTAPEDNEAVILALADRLQVRATAIGTVTDGNGVRVLDPTGRAIDIGMTGFQHFAGKY